MDGCFPHGRLAAPTDGHLLDAFILNPSFNQLKPEISTASYLPGRLTKQLKNTMHRDENRGLRIPGRHDLLFFHIFPFDDSTSF